MMNFPASLSEKSHGQIHHIYVVFSTRHVTDCTDFKTYTELKLPTWKKYTVKDAQCKHGPIFQSWLRHSALYM